MGKKRNIQSPIKKEKFLLTSLKFGHLSISDVPDEINKDNLKELLNLLFKAIQSDFPNYMDDNDTIIAKLKAKEISLKDAKEIFAIKEEWDVETKNLFNLIPKFKEATEKEKEKLYFLVNKARVIVWLPMLEMSESGMKINDDEKENEDFRESIKLK